MIKMNKFEIIATGCDMNPI
jgi:hypothetical protein